MIVMVIFGAMVLGAGAMLAPAWPTHQPRIGLTASMVLALIVGGSVFWALAFGWDTLVVDYILFALVTTIFLGGALSFGQARAEARGEELSDAEQGWTGPEDLAFFMLVGIVFVLPLLLYHAHPATNPQQFAMMGLGAKLGDSFGTFAPLMPETTYQYPPAFSALSAYLSQQLNLGMHVIQFAVAGVLGILLTWQIYDFGSEVRNKRLGRAMALALLGGLGVFSAYLNGQYTALMATVFMLAMMSYTYRFYREGLLWDAVGAGLMLGAVLITHPALLYMAIGGYVVLMGSLLLLHDHKPDLRGLALMVLGVPLLAVVATSPYLLNGNPSFALTSPLIDEGVSGGIFDALIANFGLWALPLALFGVVIGWRQNRVMTVTVALWFVVGAVLMAMGVGAYVLILPLAIAGGYALLWMWDRLIVPRIPDSRVAAVGVGAVVFIVWLISSAFVWRMPSTTISADRVAALNWMRTSSPDDAVLTVPESVSNGVMSWGQIITEREVVVVPDSELEQDAPYILLSNLVPPPDALTAVYTGENVTLYALENSSGTATGASTPDEAEDGE